MLIAENLQANNWPSLQLERFSRSFRFCQQASLYSHFGMMTQFGRKDEIVLAAL